MRKVINFRLAIAGALFFLSGAVGLIYQLVWTKILALQFGHSALSVSTVVASFMAGLSLGSFCSERHLKVIHHPFRAYGILELGIVVFGFASIPILAQMDGVMGLFHDFLKEHYFSVAVARLFLSFIVLVIPTFLMGASLPILVKACEPLGLSRDHVGWLYGINTLGAASGVFFAGFYLIPLLGLTRTIFVACMMGIVVGSIACLQKNDVVPYPSDPLLENQSGSPLGWMTAAFVMGAISLFYENGWTRLISPVFGSSTYTFSIILGIYLVGIGGGGILAATPWFERKRPLSLAASLNAIVALAGLVGLSVINQFPVVLPKLADAFQHRPQTLFLVQAILVSLFMVVPTFAMGCLLPICIRGAKGNVGGVYAANTLGAIVGVLLSGFVLFPAVGVSASFRIAAITGFLIWAALTYVDGERSPKQKMVLYGIATLVFVSSMMLPGVDLSRLHHGVFRRVLSSHKIDASLKLLFLRDGVSSSVAVYESSNDRLLKVNGKTDATLFGDLMTQYLLGHLPLFLIESPKNVCVIGLGSGATVRAVASHPVQSVDVVELEPAIIEAYRYFEPVHDNVLLDPRVRLIKDDGRAVLRYNKQLYDAIISEPSNPWIEGVSSLFSTEFYRLVKSRLTEKGVYCQWVQRYEVSVETLNTIVRTLGDVFPHVYIFVNEADLICLASDQPLTAQWASANERMKLQDVKSTLQRIRVTNPFELFIGYFASLPEDNDHFPSRIRNTDDNLWLEYRAPIEMYLGLRPGVVPISQAIVLGRFCDIFFPDLKKKSVVIGLSEAIVKNRPLAAYRIRGMMEAIDDKPTRSKLVDLANKADQIVQAQKSP